MAGTHSSCVIPLPLPETTVDAREAWTAPRERPVRRLTSVPSAGRVLGLHVDECTVQVACRERDRRESIRTRPARLAQISQEVADGTRWAERGIRYTGQRLFVGDEADDVANDGLLSGDPEGCGRVDLHQSVAEFALSRMLELHPGPALAPGDLCVFSVPAPPIGDTRDFSFHQLVQEDLIRKLGYRPLPLEDGRAVALAELDSGATSLFALSIGEQCVHGCLSYRGIGGPCFSVEPGGRWIDRRVADALGIDLAAAGRVREACRNVLMPRCREDQAVSAYCRKFVDRLMRQVVEFSSTDGVLGGLRFAGDRMELVLAGSWRGPGRFGELLVHAAGQQELPFGLCGIRIPEKPEEAVVRGCMKAALAVGAAGSSDAQVEFGR